MARSKIIRELIQDRIITRALQQAGRDNTPQAREEVLRIVRANEEARHQFETAGSDRPFLDFLRSEEFANLLKLVLSLLLAFAAEKPADPAADPGAEPVG